MCRCGAIYVVTHTSSVFLVCVRACVCLCVACAWECCACEGAGVCVGVARRCFGDVYYCVHCGAGSCVWENDNKTVTYQSTIENSFIALHNNVK
jgi:hypothetical protein